MELDAPPWSDTRSGLQRPGFPPVRHLIASPRSTSPTGGALPSRVGAGCLLVAAYQLGVHPSAQNMMQDAQCQQLHRSALCSSAATASGRLSYSVLESTVLESTASKHSLRQGCSATGRTAISGARPH
jgi:hypothetical protein